jgi:hypothetical protein
VGLSWILGRRNNNSLDLDPGFRRRTFKLRKVFATNSTGDFFFISLPFAFGANDDGKGV